MNRRAVAVLLTTLLLAGCGSEGPVEPGGPAPEDPPPSDTMPDPPRVDGDAQEGQLAFRETCASCHASRDAFDLAFFDFPPSDVIRRAVDHVDSATARNIAAYVQTLDVERRDPGLRAFQPGGGVARNDAAFWLDFFGTRGWPEKLTVDSLSGLDLRDVRVPLPFLVWSSEVDESDWMPETPLDPEILDADGGAVRTALDAYYADRTRTRLLAVVRAFRRVTGNRSPVASPVCEGGAGGHPYPLLCFEARRWVSSLSAVRLLREGETRDVPFEVAQLWWETGEAGVSLFLEGELESRTPVAAWLYMSSIFAPGGFPDPESGIAEDSGYMGQFLQSSDRPRLAALVTMRRFAEDGPVQRNQPYQPYRDLRLAVTRAPDYMRLDLLELGLEHLLELQAGGARPTGKYLELAGSSVDAYVEEFERLGGTGDAERDARIRSLIQEAREGLEGG